MRPTDEQLVAAVRLWPLFLAKLDAIWTQRYAAIEAARKQASLKSVESLSAIALDSMKVGPCQPTFERIAQFQAFFAD